MLEGMLVNKSQLTTAVVLAALIGILLALARETIESKNQQCIQRKTYPDDHFFI